MAWRMPFRRSDQTRVAKLAPVAKRTSDDTPTNLQPWQKDAWGYYKVLGEVHYGGGFYARMMAGVRILVQQRQANGDWKEVEGGEYVEQLRRLENARGGMSGLQARYGTLTFVQGESMLCRTLVGYGKDKTTGEWLQIEGKTFFERWEMLSSQELQYSKTQGAALGEYKRRRKDTGGATGGQAIPETDPDDPQPDTMYAWRFYHSDPEYSGMADSSMRAVLLDCEELVLLKQAIRNSAKSRGAGNGILVLPRSMAGKDVDQSDGTKIPKNALEIYEALTEPVEDEDAASAVAPVILFADNEVTAQHVFHVDIRGAALYKETGLRDECIRRMAIGLDMPPEALLGTSAVNHWTAWQIDEAAWKNHGAPVTREFCEQLTGALIAPLAIENGVDPATLRVWFDATDVVEDPDRGRAADEAHDRIAISDEAYRRDKGFDESDAPDDAEWERRAAIGRKPQSSTAGNAPPEQGQASVTPERLAGMADACLLRCHELAGSKLRTKITSNGAPANLRVRIRGVHNVAVTRTLGEDWRAVPGQVDADSLVAGAGQAFLEGMTSLGLEPHLAETLVQRVEEHAARTLYDPGPPALPDEVLAICALLSRRI